jgi:hypothetical protein
VRLKPSDLRIVVLDHVVELELHGDAGVAGDTAELDADDDLVAACALAREID